MPALPTSGESCDSVHLTRRAFIGAGMFGGFALAACGRSEAPTSPMSNAIAAVEAARPHSGRTVTASLTPQRAKVDIGGRLVDTLAYGDTIPGPLLRASVGDEVVVSVSNKLDHPTSVHWHGIALRNDMDGAEPATANIPAGRDFTYRFSVPNAGTYWAHPHTGLDADEGLYLPFIVDDPTEAGRYDAEWIVVLDDWTDGVGRSPRQLYEALTDPKKITSTTASAPGSPTSGSPADQVGRSDLLGGEAGDIDYPYYLINGRIPVSATVFNTKPGQRIRVRFINVASDTAFRVALAGHHMTVTHTDGFPVIPTEVDALLIGMAERYDAVLTASDGVFPLVAAAEGKNALARALLSTGNGSPPDPQFRPGELGRRVGTVDMFTAVAAADLGRPEPYLDLPVALGGTMARYDWTINGEPYPSTKPLRVREGQRPTLAFDNTTAMWHPIHLHGHTFQIMKADGTRGARKDTVMVLPKQKLRAALVANNPGTWVMHCHNTYHQEAGMMTRLEYFL